MKTYVLTVSRQFPTTHKRKGESTFFVEKIKRSLRLFEFHELEYFDPKLHTIRSNYELWAKRIKEVQEGKAILSIRYWSGKPYNSKQVEICQLDKDSGCCVQKLELSFNEKPCYVFNSSDGVGWHRFIDEDFNRLSKNDGLSLEDFKEWFKGYDLSKPMAIIHFTSFRY